jgi:hypothetical protein
MKRLAASERERKPVDAKAAGKLMRQASGRLAGEYAEAFWRSRARALAVPPLGPPTLDRLVRHAERFGCELVYKTALDGGLPDQELVTLGLELRKIADRHRRARKTQGWWKDDLQEKDRKRSRRRSGVEEDVLALHEKNPLLQPSVIADRCNISERRVKRISERQPEQVDHPLRLTRNTAQPCGSWWRKNGSECWRSGSQVLAPFHDLSQPPANPERKETVTP